MDIQQQTLQEQFVKAAVAASRLHQINSITRNMQLSALNAKIITSHAGVAGRGFQPLTAYITDLAQQTSRLVEKVNHEALLFSKHAITLRKLDVTLARINIAVAKAGESGNHPSIALQFNTIQQEHAEVSEKLVLFRSTIAKLLKEMIGLVRTARFVSANCRIEASHVDDFRSHFEAVAATLEKSMQQISVYITECEQMLGIEHNDKRRTSKNH